MAVNVGTMSSSQDPPRPAFNHDPYLDELVRIVERAKEDGTNIPYPIPLVLQTGGIVVTGSLIAEKTFFELTEELFRHISEVKSDCDDYLAIARGTTLRCVRDHYPQFIHLRDAEYLPDGDCEKLPDRPPWFLWRGRLDRVDAWFVANSEAIGAFKARLKRENPHLVP